jgi:hypothetical protein
MHGFREYLEDLSMVMVRISAFINIMILSEYIVSRCCLRLDAMQAGLVFVVTLVEMEISNNSAAAQMLAFTIVAVAKVSEPDFFEGLKVVLTDWQNFLMYNPVHHISARRVGQRSLVVIEGVNLVGRGLGKFDSLIRKLFFDSSDLRWSKSIKELGETDLFNQAEIKRTKLLNEWMAVFSFLE